MTDNIKATVRAYIAENFIMRGDGSEIAETDSFMEKHLDSTGFLELVTFLEETYGIAVDDEEMLPENLDSLNNVDAYVRRKLAA
ncbi:acyl carrier protein [Piscinibacter gummiphilus]|jgi:acyl carrier protein|uniref:Acyl carrier protein n=1 Tax=Piscinibacter gummiphilus TaxID=946333 RepID=A0A1W6LG89_9BURK|nr:acyl carrier protein [Piscinibacter gummiphilus]ARN23230.1 acyl carrier protein [Piscinibacter gummiphilus]ATU67931.1 acyl carrier protein [Piscinibacter gummiphilus]GLS97220.1 acyl carrier protein [Piscinibacter gummiphilus]